MKKPMKHALPEVLQSRVDSFINWLVNLARGRHREGVQPFSAQAGKIKAKAQAYFTDAFSELVEGQKVLREQFEQQEHDKRDAFSPDSSFSLFEEALFAGRNEEDITSQMSLQERIGLPWAFMDRAFTVAKVLFGERKYAESKAVFHFLSFLNPTVFEYTYGEAVSLLELGKTKEAITTFSRSLLLQPENPIVYFQIAHAYFQLHDLESAIQALELSIEYATRHKQENSDFAHVLVKAEHLIQELITQKAA